MEDHFSRVAEAYNAVRRTDPEPISYLADRLGRREGLRGLDVACGAGRYDLLLFRELPGLELICTDVNAAMIEETARHLRGHGVERYETRRCDLRELRPPRESLDLVLTFNAIHHLDPSLFLDKAAAALAPGGRVFIYTRLRSQNARTIWGRFFPGFHEREDRLYDLAAIEGWAESCTELALESLELFRFPRRASLDELIELVERRHYSTFSLYEPGEFAQALRDFKKAIRDRFRDPADIRWSDENIMIVFRRLGDELRCGFDRDRPGGSISAAGRSGAWSAATCGPRSPVHAPGSRRSPGRH